jgi:hypothetical protein
METMCKSKEDKTEAKDEPEHPSAEQQNHDEWSKNAKEELSPLRGFYAKEERAPQTPRVATQVGADEQSAAHGPGYEHGGEDVKEDNEDDQDAEGYKER